MKTSIAWCCGALIALVMLIGNAAAQSKQVLILHSFGRDFRPWNDYAIGIRTELERQSTWPLDIQDYPIVTARSADDRTELAFAAYLHALYAAKAPDLIISIGAPAAAFLNRFRNELFASVPALLTAVDQRFLQQDTLTPADTAVAVKIELAPLFENILRLRPETKSVLVMLGNSPPEQLWLTEMRQSLRSFEDRIEVIYCNDKSFEDMLRLAAAPPPNSAIFWTQLRVDAAGVVHEGDHSLRRLDAVANAPIFSYDETFFRGEIVGGPMLSMRDIVRQAASVAVRILGGEQAGEIKTPPIGYAAPKYDWRQLQRWNISESRLPAGSIIYFREQSTWQKYRWQILVVAAALLLQASLITGLLYERTLRRTAEGDARELMLELAHMNRQATAGEMSSSITHELNQPLGAILANAETAELMLNAQSPDLKEIRQIIADIRRDDQRASSVITRLRSLLKGQPFELKSVDLNEVIIDVIKILSAPARTRGINLIRALSATTPQVRGDAIQLQQVVLNLIVNAMDSISEGTTGRCEIVAATAPAGRFAEISIADSGPGIPPGAMKKIFEPFFTTKQQGMGMGLSIVRKIVSAHGGRIEAANQPSGGAVFRVYLPLVDAN